MRCSENFISRWHLEGFCLSEVPSRLSIIGIWDMREKIHSIMNVRKNSERDIVKMSLF